MKQFGGIKIPLEKVQEVKITSDQDAYDFLLDVEFPGQFQLLRNILKDKEKHQLVLINANAPIKTKTGIFVYTTNYSLSILLLYLPPIFMKSHKNQNFCFFVGDNLQQLEKYFIDLNNSSYHPMKISIYQSIIEYIHFTITSKSNYSIFR